MREQSRFAVIPLDVVVIISSLLLCVDGLSFQATLEKGTSFGAPSLHENTLAKMVIDAVPSVEMVRFTNSGTEVCFIAVFTPRMHNF